jgi:hypothetical protein
MLEKWIIHCWFLLCSEILCLQLMHKRFFNIFAYIKQCNYNNYDENGIRLISFFNYSHETRDDSFYSLLLFFSLKLTEIVGKYCLTEYYRIIVAPSTSVTSAWVSDASTSVPPLYATSHLHDSVRLYSVTTNDNFRTTKYLQHNFVI